MLPPQSIGLMEDARAAKVSEDFVSCDPVVPRDLLSPQLTVCIHVRVCVCLSFSSFNIPFPCRALFPFRKTFAFFTVFYFYFFFFRRRFVVGPKQNETRARERAPLSTERIKKGPGFEYHPSRYTRCETFLHRRRRHCCCCVFNVVEKHSTLSIIHAQSSRARRVVFSLSSKRVHTAKTVE